MPSDEQLDPEVQPEQGEGTPEPRAESAETGDFRSQALGFLQWARAHPTGFAGAALASGLLVGSLLSLSVVRWQLGSHMRDEVARLDVALAGIEERSAAARTALARTSAEAGAAQLRLDEVDDRMRVLDHRAELLSARLEGAGHAARARVRIAENAILDRLDAFEDLLAASDHLTRDQVETLRAEHDQIEEEAAFLEATLDENGSYDVVIVHDDSHGPESEVIAEDLRELGFQVAESLRSREVLDREVGRVGSFDRIPGLGDIASFNADEKVGMLADAAARNGLQAQAQTLIRRPDSYVEAAARHFGSRRELVLFLVD